MRPADGTWQSAALSALIILFAGALDLLFGDPVWLPHPVVGMGRAISSMERGLRGAFPETVRGELAAGTVLAAILPVGTFLFSGAAILLAIRIHPSLGFALQVFWCAQCLAMRELRKESMRVYARLKDGDLPGARTAVARIVGRDTAALTETGVARAAVETVAENFSDGVFAPLFYMTIGGAPLALAYKAVNTMDSMVGYRNERYLYFGRAAARLDDAANFLPARLSALFLILSAGLLRGFSGRFALAVWWCDRRMHESPNAGQTESACAGALDVRLGGAASYGGIPHEKPFLHAKGREPAAEDIRRANRLLYCAGCIACVVCACVRFLLVALLAGGLS